MAIGRFMVNAAFKRGFDLLCVIPGLIVLSPLLIVVALLVWWRLGRPIFFRQIRPGLACEPFEIYKFRTMTDGKDASGRPLPDRMRLTPLGIFLRNTSLDELPALFNVLKGDMSVVGPRPLFMHYLPYYSAREQVRHSVRPGITGWAQVNGRNYLPWEKRLAMDVWYVENWSLWLDLKILCMTVLHVLGRKGVSADSDAVETDLAWERGGKDKAEINPNDPEEC